LKTNSTKRRFRGDNSERYPIPWLARYAASDRERHASTKAMAKMPIVLKAEYLFFTPNLHGILKKAADAVEM